MDLSDVSCLLDALHDKLSALPFRVRGMSDAEIEELYNRLGEPLLVFPPPYIAYLRRFGAFHGDFGVLHYAETYRDSQGRLQSFPDACRRARKMLSLAECGHSDVSLPFSNGPSTIATREISCFHVQSLPMLVASERRRLDSRFGENACGPFFPVVEHNGICDVVSDFLEDGSLLGGGQRRREGRGWRADNEDSMDDILSLTRGTLAVSDWETLSTNPRVSSKQRFNDVLGEFICAFKNSEASYLMDF